MSDTPLGRFCWYDLVTPEPDEAPAFYAAVTGWGTQPFDGGAEPYTMWTNGEQPVGGFVGLPEEARESGTPPHWLAYVSTPDLRATVEKAEALGGRMLHREDVPTVGSIAILSDPQGAVFAAYQPTEWRSGEDHDPAVGEFSWHELYADDHEGALAFYSELFGWEPTDAMDMGEAGIYQMYGRGGRTYGGMMNRTDDMPPPAWLYYVRVPDVEAAAKAVQEAGGEVWNGPMEVPGGDLIACCRDAQGAAFSIHATPS